VATVVTVDGVVAHAESVDGVNVGVVAEGDEDAVGAVL
jgi:hypothetical protein